MTNWKDIFERGAWTVVQAFAGTMVAGPIAANIADIDLTSLQLLTFSALGASAAALLSFLKTIAQERLAILDTRQ